MTRFTRALNKNEFYVDDDKIIHDANGYSGAAINRLAVFENVFEDLVTKQEEISKELEKLRSENKTRSAKFRDLMAKKLANSHTLILFKTYGLQ